MALIEGDIAGSLYYNPMTMPIVLLMLVTLFSLSARAIREQPLRLPRAYLHAWGAVLLLAWIIKLLSPTASW